MFRDSGSAEPTRCSLKIHVRYIQDKSQEEAAIWINDGNILLNIGKYFVVLGSINHSAHPEQKVRTHRVSKSGVYKTHSTNSLIQ